jgi:hypothetical protein
VTKPAGLGIGEGSPKSRIRHTSTYTRGEQCSLIHSSGALARQYETTRKEIPLRISHAVLAAATAVLLIPALSACSVLAPPAAEVPADTTESSAPADEATEPVATSGNAASWASPVNVHGELLTTISGTNFSVDVYQVGTAPATKTGNFVTPDDNKPIIAVGDEVVYVNYIVTNTSSAAIPLSYLLVDVTARYADWPYLQGMDSITDSALSEQMGVNYSGLAPTSSEAPFSWEPGTSFSYGTNFLYEAGGKITFKASLTPSDADGNLVHEKNEEVEATTSIK